MSASLRNDRSAALPRSVAMGQFADTCTEANGVPHANPAAKPTIRVIIPEVIVTPAVAFALGIALKYSSRPFGNDALRVAAVTAMAVIDRLRIVAEADACVGANRTHLTGVIIAPVRDRIAQLTTRASPRTDEQSL